MNGRFMTRDHFFKEEGCRISEVLLHFRPVSHQLYYDSGDWLHVVISMHEVIVWTFCSQRLHADKAGNRQWASSCSHAAAVSVCLVVCVHYLDVCAESAVRRRSVCICTLHCTCINSNSYACSCFTMNCKND